MTITPDTHRRLFVMGPQRSDRQLAIYSERCRALAHMGFEVHVRPSRQRDELTALASCHALACISPRDPECRPAMIAALAYGIDRVDAATLTWLACDPAPVGI